MELEKFKTSLPAEQFEELSTLVADLIGQRDAARNESINGRKGLRSKVDELTAAQTRLLEKLGVDSLEDLDALPDARGQADKVAQLEAQLKRLSREREEAGKELTTLRQQRETDRKRAALASVISKHQFVDPELAQLALEARLRVEGDEFLFEADGGKLVPLDEGAAALARAKPHLVRAQGGTGSGFREGTAQAGSGAPAKRPERKDFGDEVAYFRAAAAFDREQRQAS